MSSTQFQSLLPPHPVCFTSFDELLCSINKYRQDTFPSTIDIALDMSRSTPPTIPDHTSPIPIPIPTQDGRPRSNSVPRNSHSQGRIEEEMDLPEGLRSPRTSTIPLAASVHAHDHHGDRLHEVQDEEASPVIDAVMPERLPQAHRPDFHGRSESQSSISSVESEFFEDRIKAIREESVYEADTVDATWTPPSPPKRHPSHSYHEEFHPHSPLAIPIRPILPHPGSHHHGPTLSHAGSFTAAHHRHSHSPGRHSPSTSGCQSPLSTSVPLIPVDELMNAEDVPPRVHGDNHNAHGRLH